MQKKKPQFCHRDVKTACPKTIPPLSVPLAFSNNIKVISYKLLFCANKAEGKKWRKSHWNDCFL